MPSGEEQCYMQAFSAQILAEGWPKIHALSLMESI